MENSIVFAYNNRIDTPTLAADSQVATLPVANLQSKQRKEVWRTTDTGGANGRYVIVPFDAEEFVEGFFMTNYNLTLSATYTIRAVTQAVTGGTVSIMSGNVSVSKTGGPDWTTRMNGTDILYGTGAGRRSVRIQTVTGPGSLTLAAAPTASYSGSDYFILDFTHARDAVNYPEGYRYETGPLDVWKSLWGAGEDRAGFHGAGGLPDDDDLRFIRPIEMFLFDRPNEYQFWKIHFVDAENPDGYLEIGRMFLGPLFRPTRNFVSDFIMRPFSDPSSKEDSMGQVTHSDEKQKFSQIQLDFQGVEPSEAQMGFAHMQNVVGLTRDFFVSLEPDQDYSNWFNTTFYGRLTREMALRTSRINKNLRDIDVDFRESL